MNDEIDERNEPKDFWSMVAESSAKGANHYKNKMNNEIREAFRGFLSLKPRCYSVASEELAFEAFQAAYQLQQKKIDELEKSYLIFKAKHEQDSFYNKGYIKGFEDGSKDALQALTQGKL